MSSYHIDTMLYPLPSSVRGFVQGNGGDYFTIVLNSHLDAEELRDTCIHEIAHLVSGDCVNDSSADDIERMMHTA